MSALTGHVSDYLAMRRALGYKLERATPATGHSAWPSPAASPAT